MFVIHCHTWNEQEGDHDLHYSLAVFYCHVLGRKIPSLQTCLCPSSYMVHQPAPRRRTLPIAEMRKQNNQDHVCCDLSSTLEKLCMWENKLYGEVVVNKQLCALTTYMPYF